MVGVNNFRFPAASDALPDSGIGFASNSRQATATLILHRLKMKPFSNEVSAGCCQTPYYHSFVRRPALSGDDYHSLIMGIRQNMLWRLARCRLMSCSVVTLILSRTSGASYHLSTANKWMHQPSTISLALYRFSDRHFRSYAALS